MWKGLISDLVVQSRRLTPCVWVSYADQIHQQGTDNHQTERPPGVWRKARLTGFTCSFCPLFALELQKMWNMNWTRVENNTLWFVVSEE